MYVNLSFLEGFFGIYFGSLLDLCDTPHPTGLAKMGSAYT